MKITSQFTGTLKEDQKEALVAIKDRKRSVLNLPVGRGKTITSLCMALETGIPVVVLLPKNAIKSWTGDLSKWFEGLDWVLNDSQVPLKGELTLVPYSRSKKWLSCFASEMSKKEHFLILDEIDEITNTETTLYEVVGSFSKIASRVLGLTGTPVQSNLEKTYNYLRLIVVHRHPLGTLPEFRRRFLEQKKRTRRLNGGRKHVFYETIKYKNLESFRRRIQPVVYTTISDANVQFKYFEFELDYEEMDAYEEAASRALSSDAPASGLHELQKLCSKDSKKEVFKSAISKLVERGNPFLVYATYRESAHDCFIMLEEEGVETYIITGQTSQPDRASIISTLDKGGPIAVVMTKAGTRAANLQKAESVWCYEIPFDVNTMIQLMGRVTRIGSDFKVNYVFFMYALNCIEEYKMNLMKMNADLILKVLRGISPLPQNELRLTRKDVIDSRKETLWKIQNVASAQSRATLRRVIS